MTYFCQKRHNKFFLQKNCLTQILTKFPSPGQTFPQIPTPARGVCGAKNWTARKLFVTERIQMLVFDFRFLFMIDDLLLCFKILCIVIIRFEKYWSLKNLRHFHIVLVLFFKEAKCFSWKKSKGFSSWGRAYSQFTTPRFLHVTVIWLSTLDFIWLLHNFTKLIGGIRNCMRGSKFFQGPPWWISLLIWLLTYLLTLTYILTFSFFFVKLSKLLQ